MHVQGPPFPIDIDQVDEATLTQAMGRPVAGFAATRIGAERGMLGEIFVLDLTYADGEAAGPAQVIAKFAALREGSLASAQRGGTHERELRCYSELLSETPVNAPLAYGAWYDSATAHFLLIQDAVDADESIEQTVGLDIDRAKLVLSEAARLHATWWQSPRLGEFGWLPRLDSEQRRNNLTTIAAAGWEPLCTMLGDELTGAERCLGTRFPEHLDQALRAAAAHPSTVIHSDLRTDNLLFSPDGSSVSLIDWQGAGIGPPAFDLAYFLSQCLTVEVRRAHEDELLTFYSSELAQAGVTLTDNQVRAGYADSMLFGLAIACAVPLVGDPTEPRVQTLTATIARRSIEALRDHDRLWNQGTQ